jgi:hypothetical protein
MFTASSGGLLRSVVALVPALVFLPLSLSAQTSTTTERDKQIESRLDAVIESLDATRKELKESRAEIRALQQELSAMKQQPLGSEGPSNSGSQSAAELAGAVATLKEGQEVLQAEVAEHEQSKVETRSKYSLKLSGLLLFNSFVNNGAVDNAYVPVIAVPQTPETANGSTGATLRQTILGFDAKGPKVFGAESHADVRVDFFGGETATGYESNDGLLRLRTAHANLEWHDTQLIATLDKPIFSPLTPTSLAVVGVSPLGWSGNLWTWLPQLEVSHNLRLGKQNLRVEAGVIDVADPPAIYGPVAQPVSAAQRSLYPGSELLLSYSGNHDGHAATIGVGGYWSPHKYDYGQQTDAWAVTADWMLPLTSKLELSGEFYRGQALGGLGGGTYKDVVVYKPDAAQYTQVNGLNALGGWGQLKFRMNGKIEWNAAAGQDNAYANQLHQAQLTYTNPYSTLARNQTIFGNVIYKPSSYLLFSFEYRNIRTWPIYGSGNTAQSYVFTTGYEF